MKFSPIISIIFILSVSLNAMEPKLCLIGPFAKLYPLHDAAGRGNVERVRSLLATINIDLQEKYNLNTPLAYAVTHGRKTVVEFLLNSGANVNLSDKIGFSPLDHSIMLVHDDCNEITKLLLDYDATVGQRDLDLAINWTNPIAFKMIRNKLKGIPETKLTSSKKKKLRNRKKTFEELLALSPEQFEQKMVQNPGLITLKNEKSENLLAIATARQLTQYVKILLAYEQRTSDDLENSCNDFCVFSQLKKTRSLDLARLILKAKPLEDRYRILRDPQEHQYEDSFACFVAHYGRSQDQLFNVLLLADYQILDEIFTADPAVINRAIQTTHAPQMVPLAWARSMGDQKLTEYLLKKGALEFFDNESGLLKKLIRNNDIQAIDNCLRHGALVNTADERGMAPLHWASVYGMAEIIAYLIEQGGDVNMVDLYKSRTPLRCTMRMHEGSIAKGGKQLCTSELLPCFFFLTAAGANTKIQDINGQNVSHWMTRQGFSEDVDNVISSMLYQNYSGFYPGSDQIIRKIFEIQLKELNSAISRKDDAKIFVIKKALIADKIGDNEYSIKPFYVRYLKGDRKIVLKK